MSSESPTPADAASAECCGGDEHCAPHPAEHIAQASALSGCPKPLSWQEVLQTYQAESTPFTVNRGTYTLQGRSWGTGRPLYLLNGMGGTSDQMCLLIYLLREQYRCVIWDYPGRPGDRSRLSRLNLRTFASDVNAVADHLQDEQVDLFATSMGSLVALQTALEYAPRVRRVAIQGGFARRQLAFAERLLIRVGRCLPGPVRWLPGRQLVHENNHRRWFPPLDPSRWEFFLSDAGAVATSVLAHRGGIIRDTDLRPQLAQIQQPVMLVHCEGDGLVTQECLDELAAGLPHHRVEWFHGAGHLPFLTHPHRLGKLIRDFLEAEDPLAVPPPPRPIVIPAGGSFP